ncbi:MAG: Carboxy-S-adenosyl-L-methionine synthase [Chroococcidiopsis cubana SAG 39.79]|uniref:Methyltransferase type 12 domain-containing protein n=1 Tax=Chroococcidiopsis cubana SAG 39.79 TaxID=388085 RepID=A0AB37UAE9_9CYAN|nr:methyltransferase [Chroococcidiopsis cubana]MDZ4877334.1 Carboxy-S-adenosyl-L-methionine synthase [Chroococcidiopsis cubana SAG 39.79]PSB61257.1 ubiquinone biosynthesis protein UbiE [Chroococcidiopsis cubana CCALA 043]RUT00688.1 hypothetical protein DSM107010_67400 [Chroococcidiopsis cubana SAG 39.79]
MINRTQLELSSVPFQPCEYFNDNWQIYQKVLQNDYIKHRELYNVLHKFLLHRVQKPFQLLDLGCGDASITVPALLGTSIHTYYGIDLSQAAIAIAQDSLAVLPCPKTLITGDFTALVPQLLGTHQQSFDIILASFSLHHLKLTQKSDLIGQLFQLLNSDGVLILIDIVRQEAEDRITYIDRYLKNVRQDWTALTPQEVVSVETHIISSDFPETQKTLQQLALKHGFSWSECLYQDSLEFWQLLCFYK